MQVKYPVNTHQTLKLELGPFVVEQGEENVYRATIPIGRQGWDLKEVWVFQGRDWGDEAEMDCNIWDGTDPLYLRSDHNIVRFDAWTTHRPEHRIRKNITVSLLARSGGNPRLDRSYIRPHWGIYFRWDNNDKQE